MSRNSTWDFDPPKLASSALRAVQRSDVGEPDAEADFESDLGELARKLAEHGGGCLSPRLSADLALEVVLNQIAEQACLATGATGAAILLERDGEMVCRASIGTTSGQLGMHLGTANGLSALCLQTRQIQRCDDTKADRRADVEASRELDVRSVLVLPILRNGEVLGLFEILSSKPSAFGERDERTLEALAHRVLKNLDQAAESFSAAVETPPVPQAVVDDSAEISPPYHDLESRVLENHALENHAAVSETAAGHGIDMATRVLGVAVLACVVLLGVLVAQRLRGASAAPRVHAAKVHSATVPRQQGESLPGPKTQGVSAAPPTTQVTVHDPAPKATPNAPAARDAASTVGRPASPAPPAGGLLVYDHGKEVFRMSPTAEGATAPQGDRVERASSVEPARIVKLSSTAAEESLLQRVEPDYPEAARQGQIQGTVELQVGIGQDGTVQQVTAVSGPPVLARAAIEAVKQWRFKPRIVNGQAMEMQTKITLNFRLPRNSGQ